MRAAFTLVSVANIVIEASVNVISAGASRKFIEEWSRGLVAYLRKVTIYGALAIASLLAPIVVAPKFWLRAYLWTGIWVVLESYPLVRRLRRF